MCMHMCMCDWTSKADMDFLLMISQDIYECIPKHLQIKTYCNVQRIDAAEAECQICLLNTILEDLAGKDTFSENMI